MRATYWQRLALATVGWAAALVVSNRNLEDLP